MAPLSEAEFNELDRFLASDATSDQTMMIDALDGYLTAVVIGPVDVPTDEWLPSIWGPKSDHAPTLQFTEQGQRILDLIVRHCNGIRWAIDYDPDDIDSIFDTASYHYVCNIHLEGIDPCSTAWVMKLGGKMARGSIDRGRVRFPIHDKPTGAKCWVKV